MCIDPFTAMVIAGTAISAGGSIMQGNTAAALGEAQQRSYNQAADAESKSAGYEAAREFDQQNREQAAARARIGASGVAVTGSPATALAGNAGRGQLDLEAIRYGSQIKQNDLRMQGTLAAWQGSRARTAGYISAAGDIAKGGASLFNPANSVRMGANPFAKPMNLTSFTRFPIRS